MWLFNFIKSINLSRFVAALVLAVFVWGYVTLTVYPEQSNTYEDIPVDIVKPQATDLMVRSNYKPTSVTVKVSGPRDKVTAISATALRPYIDLSNITKPTTDQFKVQLKVPDGVRYSIEPDRVEVQIEQKRSVTFKVEAQPTGEVSPDYNINNITVTPETVEVNGPASLVSQVKRVVARVDVSNRNISLVGRVVKVALLGANNEELKLDEVTVNPDSVSVDVRVDTSIQTRPVPIRVTTSGQPALGYVIGSTTRDPSIVTIWGDPGVISQVEYVDTEPVDVSGLDHDFTTDVAIKTPPDVVITQPNKKVHVTISISPLEVSSSVEQQVEQINIGPNLRYEFLPNRITVTLSGTYQVFQQLQQQQFKLEEVKAQVNLAGKGPGEYTNVPVQITAPPGLQVVNNPTVTVRIVREATPTPVPPRTPTRTPIPQPTPTPSPTPVPTETSPRPADVITTTLAASVPTTPNPPSSGTTTAPPGSAAPPPVTTKHFRGEF